jgi:hypothetical protein
MSNGSAAPPGEVSAWQSSVGVYGGTGGAWAHVREIPVVNKTRTLSTRAFVLMRLLTLATIPEIADRTLNPLSRLRETPH